MLPRHQSNQVGRHAVAFSAGTTCVMLMLSVLVSVSTALRALMNARQKKSQAVLLPALLAALFVPATLVVVRHATIEQVVNIGSAALFMLCLGLLLLATQLRVLYARWLDSK